MSQNQIVIGSDVGESIGMLDGVGPERRVFIDGVNGDDRRLGLGAEDSMRTIRGARKKHPMEALDGARIIFELAGVGGFGADATGQLTYDELSLPMGGREPTASGFRIEGPEMVPGILTSGPAVVALDLGAASDRVDNTGAISATGRRTRLNFTVAAPGWTVDDFADKFCRVTRAGVLVFPEMPIGKNGIDTLFLDSEIVDTIVLDTDLVEIVVPGAKIESNPLDPVSLGKTLVYGFVGFGPSNTFGITTPAALRRLAFGDLDIQCLGLSLDRCLIESNIFRTWRNSSITTSFLSIGGFTVLDASSWQFFFQPDGTFISTAVRACWLQHTDFSLINSVGAFFFWDAPVSSWDARFGGLQLNGGTGFIQAASNGDNGAGSFGMICNQGTDIAILGGTFSNMLGANGAFSIDGLAVDYGAAVGAFEEVAGFAGNATRKNEGTATAPLGGSSRVHLSSIP